MPFDRLAACQQYLDALPYPPYPLQEEAILGWFMAEQGVLMCAPTGTGKTLVAQAALYEALAGNTVAYYTTPLIALTEQKFTELQASAVRWGFSADDVGLVTGHRKVNPRARVLVVVAEILLNRLLHRDADGEAAEESFDHVSAVVMDEFHSFADPERGIVWELSLAMLPKHVRLMLLSATVGNAPEFLGWLQRSHGRSLELVEGRERKVPLTYRWVPDMLLNEQVVEMCKGGPVHRTTPALVFCFNRDLCWSVAEQLKGLDLLPGIDKGELHDAVDALEWKDGVGPKLKQMLHRGVGVHHAGLLPKYRRAVEKLFEQKLLAVAVCTETLAAGINLPARSVLLTSLVKGPRGKEKLIDPSNAQQMFGRAGRPQYDTQGFVFAVAHEDDVKLLRWQKKYDSIPETTKDPGLLKAKKELKRKKPSRRDGEVYWTEGMFTRLQTAQPGKLYSKGPLPWRLLAYLLRLSPEVARIRLVIRKRLMDQPRIEAQEKTLERMLFALAKQGFVTLDPPRYEEFSTAMPPAVGAHATDTLSQLLAFRSVHPLYACWLLDRMGQASPLERLQILESVLEMPTPMLRYVRVPRPEELPPGPLEEAINPELVNRGLIEAPKPPPAEGEEDDEEDDDKPPWYRPPTVAEKLLLLFDAQHPEVGDVTAQPVWAAAELIGQYGGQFNAYVRSRDLAKQEGMLFRHFLRLILLAGEFSRVTPAGMDAAAWKAELRELADRLTESCRAVDPQSTDEVVRQVEEGDVVDG